MEGSLLERLARDAQLLLFFVPLENLVREVAEVRDVDDPLYQSPWLEATICHKLFRVESAVTTY